MDQRLGVGDRVRLADIFAVAGEHQAVPRVGGHEVDAQAAGNARILAPSGVFLGAVSLRGGVVLHEAERRVPLARVAVVQGADHVLAGACRGGLLQGERQPQDVHGCLPSDGWWPTAGYRSSRYPALRTVRMCLGWAASCSSLLRNSATCVSTVRDSTLAR